MAGEVRFSVVVPTFRRSVPLAACLQALAELEYPPELFEVIVVDDGGGLSAEVLSFIRARANMTLVTQPNAGPAAARNTGASHAANAYVAFTDDDCQPDRKWLNHLADHVARYPEHLLAGPTVNLLSDNVFAIASHTLLDYLYASYRTDQGQPRFFATSNLALPVARFRELGGFNTTFRSAAGEDREFCARWRDAGGEITYAPDCVVRHAHHLTLYGFVRQHFRYGTAVVPYRSCRGKRTERRLDFPSPRFYWAMLRFPFRQSMEPSRQLLVASLLSVSQATYAIGALVGLMGHRSRPR